MNKRGQFFILAAVILSLFLFSTAFTANRALTTQKNPDLHYYAEDIKREINSFLDYQTHNNLGINDLDNLIETLKDDFRNHQTQGNFLLIYGNKTNITISNLGKETVQIGDKELKGASDKINSKIRIGGINLNVNQFAKNNKATIKSQESINLSFNEHIYKIKLLDNNQVIFIIQKDIDNETYIEIR